MKKMLAVMAFASALFAGCGGPVTEYEGPISAACGRIECNTDSQCDRKCGGHVSGSCVQVDSCSRLCFCSY